MIRKVTGNWRGLDIEGKYIEGDWEGDPDVPRGVNYLPAYIDDLQVTTPGGDDITEFLNKGAVEECVDILLGDY